MKSQVSLDAMLEDLRATARIYRPSNFWTDLNSYHSEQLNDSGLLNFKRSINGKYFGFGWNIPAIMIHEYFPFVHSLIRGNIHPYIFGEFKDYDSGLNKGIKKFNPLTAFLYKIYICNLFDYVSLQDKYGILNKLNESLVGNPFLVEYRGKKLSQDLCNSVHEFYSATKIQDMSKIKNVAEIGAGYGRLAHVFLKTLPKISYTIIDIPPALFVSQWYLSKVFPGSKIFFYRRFKSYQEIKEEFESSRIRFLMSDQIELLPRKSVDLMINISSLHEMKREQINNFIFQMDKLTKGFCYIKQWHKSRTKDNLWIKQNEYPIPKKWKVISSRFPHPIQSWFFDTLYEIL